MSDPALRLRDDERRYAYLLAAGASALFFVSWQPWRGGQRLIGFALGVVFTAGLAFAARRGHRVWTAFAAFLVGFDPAWGAFFIFGAAYIAFAFWLAWRAHRTLKATLNADPNRVRATPMPPPKRVTPKRPGRT